MNSRRVVTTVVAALCLGSVVAACVPPNPPPPPPPPPPAGLEPPDSPLPPGSPSLTTQILITGLVNPWDMSFLADGTMFFTERQGTIKVRKTDTSIATAVDTPGDLVTDFGRGLMGLAVREPDVASNVPIYLCYSATSGQRVVRYDYNLLTGIVSPVVTNIVTIPLGSDHNGCRIRFGPDGLLWIGTGDANIGTGPQDLNSLVGKVLRVNPDGSAAAGNPFIGQNGDDRIYTYGHRNLQGFGFKGSSVYSIEHGSAVDDEVNRLVAGGNGGWNPVGEGGFFPGYDGHDTFPPMTDFSLPNCCMVPVWKSGEPTVAPSGGTIVTGSQWGSWNGALVVAFLKDSQARVMVLDGAGGVATSSPFLGGFGRLRSVVQGPDGNLYVSTDNGANDVIFRVTP